MTPQRDSWYARGGDSWDFWQMAGCITQANVGQAISRLEELSAGETPLRIEMGELSVEEGATMTVLTQALGDLSRRRPIALHRPPPSLADSLESTGRLGDPWRITLVESRP